MADSRRSAQAREDIAEGMDRMQDEGGGVVEQSNPAGAPILRNRLEQDSSRAQIPGVEPQGQG